jgi:hypothetical protein
LAAEVAGNIPLAIELMKAGETSYAWGMRCLPRHKGVKVASV